MQWKAKGQCSKGRQQAWKENTIVPASRSRTQSDRKRPSKGSIPRGGSPAGRKDQKTLQKLTQKEIVRIRRVIVGILPYVKNYKTESGCKFAELRHTEVDSHPSKKSKKSGRKGSVALLKKSEHLGCVIQEKEPPRSKSILRKSTESFQDQIAPFDSQNGTLHHKKNQERKELFRSTNVTSAVVVLQNLRMEHRKKPCKQNDATAEKPTSTMFEET